MSIQASSDAKFFIGGNWKCNGSKDVVNKLINELNAGAIPANVDVVCAPPYVYIPQVRPLDH